MSRGRLRAVYGGCAAGGRLSGLGQALRLVAGSPILTGPADYAGPGEVNQGTARLMRPASSNFFLNCQWDRPPGLSLAC